MVFRMSFVRQHRQVMLMINVLCVVNLIVLTLDHGMLHCPNLDGLQREHFADIVKFVFLGLSSLLRLVSSPSCIANGFMNIGPALEHVPLQIDIAHLRFCTDGGCDWCNWGRFSTWKLVGSVQWCGTTDIGSQNNMIMHRLTKTAHSDLIGFGQTLSQKYFCFIRRLHIVVLKMQCICWSLVHCRQSFDRFGFFSFTQNTSKKKTRFNQEKNCLRKMFFTMFQYITASNIHPKQMGWRGAH